MKNTIWNDIDKFSPSKALAITTGSGLPRGQVSKDDSIDYFGIVKGHLEFIKPEYNFDVVPIIRKLVYSNPDISQAFKDIIQLANTGHEITFDNGVSKDDQIKMKEALDEASVNWCEGTAGLHGIINKMFAQCMIGGAISNEWVPNNSLTDLARIKFLNPENIRYMLKPGKIKYIPYQKLKNNIIGSGFKNRIIDGQYIKLNPTTFRYYALYSDTDLPYGIPPYLPSITPVSTQTRMLSNIDEIVSTMGILGWAEAKMDKPDALDGEDPEIYTARLNTILSDLKERMRENLRSGVSVGFKDDHEFEFKTTVKDASGMDSLWAHNEQQLASAIDFDSAFMGRSYNTSETMITILFTKMVSQLSNVQEVVEANLKYGLSLFFRLRGFNFKSIDVQFNKSTITDDLKYQQANEIKLRNLVLLYKMGTIDEFTFAKLSGFSEPFQNKPRVDISEIDSKSKSKEKEEKEKKKDKSERESKAKRKEGVVRRTKPITSE